MTASRTSLSIKNAKVAFLFYLVTGILNFVSRKIFIDHLGAEVLGLNATATNLLNFLNIAELGIGIAISYALYAPLATKDNETISEIVSVQGYWYRKIGFIILAASLITMCFFPVFFAKMHLPLWYAYACFVALLASSLFSYFWNYRQIVLSADQKQYKITTILQGWKGIKIILQILAVIYLRNGFIYWVLLEFITSVLQTISLSYRINKEYPWLKASPSKGKMLQKKYPEIITKTKQLFFHKIGSLVLTQTSPLILYAFTTLTLVAMYDNYLIVIIGITALLNSIFTSIGASVGNLVAQGDKKLIDNIFWELFSIRFLLVSTICTGVYWMAQPFITLWVGSQYLLDNTSLLLLVLIMYINLMRTVVDSFISAYGLFEDVWATLTEAALNLGLSILLGYYYGIHGILTGALISLIVIIFIWKPWFCYHRGFKKPISSYLSGYLTHALVFAGVLSPLLLLSNVLFPTTSLSTWQVLIHGFAVTIIYFVAAAIALNYVSKGMRQFSNRITQVIRSAK